MADSVVQAPVHNPSVVGAHVYSHSGEFSPQVTDVEIAGRGVTFALVRKYRSGRGGVEGTLGRGWSFSYAKRLALDGRDVVYHDGFGRTHRFGAAPRGGFASPAGFYSVLEPEGAHLALRQRYGDVLMFEDPAAEGRLLAILDRNGNALRFDYGSDVVTATDPLGRQMTLTLAQGRLIDCRDHVGREWSYRYDEHGCLTEVLQPVREKGSARASIRYGYDVHRRLASVTDPNGNTFLRNTYDDQGRVQRQEHGRGLFAFDYAVTGKTAEGAHTHRTSVTLKNGALFILTHDADGHAIESSLRVANTSLDQADATLPAEASTALTTRSKFNVHGELVERTYPAGNSTVQVFDEGNDDARARGNLLTIVQRPASGVESDQAHLTTSYAYESVHQQLVSATDPRGVRVGWSYDDQGNLTTLTYPETATLAVDGGDAHARPIVKHTLVERFRYNRAGQIISRTDGRGSRSEYYYHHATSPGGNGKIRTRDLTQDAGGYLARVVVDADYEGRPLQASAVNLRREYLYDTAGNVSQAFDGKGNATSFAHDANNRTVEIRPRDEATGAISIRYDANGNVVERMRSFNRRGYDRASGALPPRSTTIRELLEYNALNNMVSRTIEADEGRKTTTLARDASEQVVRRVTPIGDLVEYDYDERGLVIAITAASGTGDESTTRYAYSANGRLTRVTDALGHRRRYVLDGFDRYRSAVGPDGVVTRRWLDPLGHVERLTVAGVTPLLESMFQYDEMGRLVRMDRSWNDLETGAALGSSHWDGHAGRTTSVVQYDDHHQPSRIWSESGNVLTFDYDGAGRMTALSDVTGESLSFGYDENTNPVRVERRGPAAPAEAERLRLVVEQRFDAMDRVVSRALEGERPVTFSYDALGSLIEHTNEAGAKTIVLRDSFGRPSGRMRSLNGSASRDDASRDEWLVERFAWGDDDRLIAWTNASGHTTRRQYDAAGRVTSALRPDGTVFRLRRDACGNVIRSTDPNGTVTMNRFDERNRVVAREVENAAGARVAAERFHYDGLGRIVRAVAGDVTTERRYDSLSRLQAETQDGRTVSYMYDAAGRCTIVRYPSGREVRRTFDAQGRVIDVRDAAGTIARYSYGASTQLLRQELGDALEARFEYEPKRDRLSRLSYRVRPTGEIAVNHAYGYDRVGRLVLEQHGTGTTEAGNRYFYDPASRLTKVQYGVSLSSDRGPFEEEVRFERTPAGLWRMKSTHTGNGETRQERATSSAIERYLNAGDTRFAHDANGNRILEDHAGSGRRRVTRYTYDYANRMTGAGQGVDGRLPSVRYVYDAFGRQVKKHVSDNGASREYARTWDGNRIIEEWKDGALATSFVYGGAVNDLLKMYRHGEGGVNEFYYLRDGKGDVSGLYNPAAGVVERYQYDVNGLPRGASEAVLFGSASGNPFLAGSQFWDADIQRYMVFGHTFDAVTGEFMGIGSGLFGGAPTAGTPIDPEDVGLELLAGFGFLALGMIIGGPLEWGFIVAGAILIFDAAAGSPLEGGLIDVFGNGSATGQGSLGLPGGRLGTGGYGSRGRGGGGHGGGGYGGGGRAPGGSGGSGGSSGSGGGSSGGWGSPSGQPEDRPFKEGDSGSSGGGSPSTPSGGGGTGGGDGTPSTPAPSPPPSSGSSDKKEEKKEGVRYVHLNANGQWVYDDTGEPYESDDKKDKGGGSSSGGSMGNPDDGTDEGIDKDWWRSLPNRSALDVASDLKYGPKVDELERTVSFNLSALPGRSIFEAPRIISVDEGGEGVSINLSGVHGNPSAAGTGTTDGWGDKPRSWAEAVAAPRIRDATKARF